jgi:predicted GIY-YIG superfamily endonuclease
VSEGAVYRMYDADGGLLWIGTSLNVPSRLAQHRSERGWWPEVARIDIQHFDDLRVAARTEVEAIKLEAPRYNKAASEFQYHASTREEYQQRRRDAKLRSRGRVAARRAEIEAQQWWHPTPGTVVCSNCDRIPERMPKGKAIEEVECLRCGCKFKRERKTPSVNANTEQLSIAEQAA